MKLLADTDFNAVIGKITPPAGMVGFDKAGIGGVIALGIRLFLIFASLIALLFLMWGALDYITSGGEKEKVSKAQLKITQALVGIFVIIVALALFQLVTGPILGIFDTTGGNLKFTLPTL